MEAAKQVSKQQGPHIVASRVIGNFAGNDMHAWDEVFADGSTRHFEEYVSSVFCPSLGRDIGLTLAREVKA